MNVNSKLIGIGAAIFGALIIAFLASLWLGPDRGNASGVRSGAIKVSGEAQIGGAFTLVNHLGETVTQDDFLGKPMLVYFGFTYCADTCPMALQNLNAALTRLDAEDREKIQPVFVSIDPERDTPEQLALFVTTPAIPENLIGLTGSDEQVREAASAYRIYYARVEDEGSYAGYFMDHTSMFFLMDEAGRFAEVFADQTDPQLIAARLQDFLDTRAID